MTPQLVLVLVVVLIVAFLLWYLRKPKTTAPPPTLALADITPLGILRVDQVLGSGGTGSLTQTGNGCFWVRPDGKIAFFQIGQFAPEWYPSGWPIIEWEIDPAVTPGKEMSTAPRMKYCRTIGDFFNGHIIASSGRQENWIPGGWAPVEDRGGGVLRFRWTYSDGYTGGSGYPQYGLTDLDYAAGTFRSYGPFKIAVEGHRHLSSQIIKLPEAFRDQYCPGYSYAGIGVQGSGSLGSPFGSSLIAIEDVDPTTLPPHTNATDPPTVKSIYLLHHGPDTKMRRPANFALCGWDTPYDCRLGSTITPALPLFGGTPNGGNTGVETNDTQVGVVWVDLPDRHGLVFFFRLTATPAGYRAPNDPHGFVHAGYGSAFHGDTGSGYPHKGCCHAVEGVGQFDPDWGSTGPFANFHMPCASIYDPQELVQVRHGAKQLWECVPTADELKDWGDVDPLFKVVPPTHATDYANVIFLTGTNWVDVRDRRLYVLSAADYATAYGACLPHLSVYAIKGGTTPPITPPTVPGRPTHPIHVPVERRTYSRRSDAGGRRVAR
jgi:hypothetical protein